MTRDADHEGLRRIVYAIIDAQKGEERVRPAAVATLAMAELGAAELQASKPLVYFAAAMHLRQMARHACRKQYEPDPDDEDALDAAQQNLFPGLQVRYPAARSDDQEPAYVLREAMKGEDVYFNISRLRREGKTKLGRADALELWWETRKGSEPVPPAA